MMASRVKKQQKGYGGSSVKTGLGAVNLRPIDLRACGTLDRGPHSPVERKHVFVQSIVVSRRRRGAGRGSGDKSGEYRQRDTERETSVFGVVVGGHPQAKQGKQAGDRSQRGSRCVSACRWCGKVKSQSQAGLDSYCHS